MDRLRLIAEISARPALWDLKCEEYKKRADVSAYWKEVATKMGPDATVDRCKRKWKILRDTYRAEINRIKLQIERDLLKGTYDRKKVYTSKWAYFEQMKFLKDMKRPRRRNIGEQKRKQLVQTYPKEIKGKELRIEKAPQKGTYDPSVSYAIYFESMSFLRKDNQTHSRSKILNTSINLISDRCSERYTIENIEEEPLDIKLETISLPSNEECDDSDKDNEMGNKYDFEAEALRQTQVIDLPETVIESNSTDNCLLDQESADDVATSACEFVRGSYKHVKFLQDLANTNENTINNNISNNESVKSVQFSNAEIVHIKEEPADVEEINNANEEQELMKSSRSKILNTSINLVPDRCSERYTIANIKEEPLDIKLETISLCSNEECDDSDKDKEMGNKYDFEAEVLRQIQVEDLPETVIEPNSTDNCLSDQESADDVATSACEFVRGSHKHVKFLEDLAKEEQELMKSTTQDIKRSNAYLKSDDSDYNFLLSYLPQMKSMNKKQNLQFREKVADLTLKILSHNDASVS